jgi:Tol biopolymer transport system component
VGGWWAFSRDGSAVTFNSARNFVSADTDTVRDPYLARVDLPQVVLLAERRFSRNDGDCHALELGTAISGDGRWVLFQSDNPRFDEALSYQEPDYYLRDLAQGDRGEAGLRALRLRPGMVDQPALSGDGRVAVITGLTRIEDGGSRQRGVTPHLFRVDLTAAPAIEVVDRDGSGRVLEVERGGFTPSLSDDARSVAFATVAPLLPEDQNDDVDVYVRVWW